MRARLEHDLGTLNLEEHTIESSISSMRVDGFTFSDEDFELVV